MGGAICFFSKKDNYWEKSKWHWIGTMALLVYVRRVSVWSWIEDPKETEEAMINTYWVILYHCNSC